MALFQTTIKTVTGKAIKVIVKADNEGEARIDMRTAIQAQTKMPNGMIRIGDLSKIKRLPEDAEPIKGCKYQDRQWAWWGF